MTLFYEGLPHYDLYQQGGQWFLKRNLRTFQEHFNIIQEHIMQENQEHFQEHHLENLVFQGKSRTKTIQELNLNLI